MIDLKKLVLTQVTQYEYTQLKKDMGLSVAPRPPNPLFGFCVIREPLIYSRPLDLLLAVLERGSPVRDITYKDKISGMWAHIPLYDLDDDRGFEHACNILDDLSWFVLRLPNESARRARHRDHEINFDLSSHGIVSISCVIPGRLRSHYSWDTEPSGDYIQFAGIFPNYKRSVHAIEEPVSR